MSLRCVYDYKHVACVCVYVCVCVSVVLGRAEFGSYYLLRILDVI